MTVRLHALLGIAASGRPHRLAWIVPLLADPSGGIRCNAVEVLLRQAPRLLRPHRARLLADDKAYIRRLAAQIPQALTSGRR